MLGREDEGTEEGRGPGGEGSRGERSWNTSPGRSARLRPCSVSPTLRMATTPQPHNKCYFNSGCSSDPVISSCKRQVSTFQVQIVYCDSISLAPKSPSSQKQPKQEGSPLGHSSPSVGLWSGGSRLSGAIWIAPITTPRRCTSSGDNTEALLHRAKFTPGTAGEVVQWLLRKTRLSNKNSMYSLEQSDLDKTIWTCVALPSESHQAGGL